MTNVKFACPFSAAQSNALPYEDERRTIQGIENIEDIPFFLSLPEPELFCFGHDDIQAVKELMAMYECGKLVSWYYDTEYGYIAHTRLV